jgi:hypothetical protein
VNTVFDNTILRFSPSQRRLNRRLGERREKAGAGGTILEGGEGLSAHDGGRKYAFSPRFFASTPAPGPRRAFRSRLLL